MGTVLRVGLIQRFLFRFINPVACHRSIAHIGQLFFDKADIAAAFHACDPNFRKVVRVYAETHVFVQIVR